MFKVENDETYAKKYIGVREDGISPCSLEYKRVDADHGVFSATVSFGSHWDSWVFNDKIIFQGEIDLNKDLSYSWFGQRDVIVMGGASTIRNYELKLDLGTDHPIKISKSLIYDQFTALIPGYGNKTLSCEFK